MHEKQKMNFQEKHKEQTLVKEKVQKEYEIVVFNDEVNTFDHVIETLIKTCDHSPIQAEQCTYIIHFNGKCTLKSGDYEDLRPRCENIIEAGISAEII